MILSSQKIIILSISVVLVTGTLGFDWIESLFPPAEAHGVQAPMWSRFIRIEDETFNRQSLQTGEVLTVSGQLVSLVERDLRGWISIFSESTNGGNGWEVVAKDPPGSVDIEGNTTMPYSVSAIALEEGVYHVHTLLNVASVGSGLGPGQTVVVEGDPIIKPIPYTNIVPQSITFGKHFIMFAISQWQVFEYILLIFGDLILF